MSFFKLSKFPKKISEVTQQNQSQIISRSNILHLPSFIVYEDIGKKYINNCTDA